MKNRYFKTANSLVEALLTMYSFEDEIEVVIDYIKLCKYNGGIVTISVFNITHDQKKEYIIVTFSSKTYKAEIKRYPKIQSISVNLPHTSVINALPINQDTALSKLEAVDELLKSNYIVMSSGAGYSYENNIIEPYRRPLHKSVTKPPSSNKLVEIHESMTYLSEIKKKFKLLSEGKSFLKPAPKRKSDGSWEEVLDESSDLDNGITGKKGKKNILSVSPPGGFNPNSKPIISKKKGMPKLE